MREFNREKCFKDLLLKEKKQNLTTQEKYNHIQQCYMKDYRIDELYFSDRVYLENVIRDYKRRKREMQKFILLYNQ